MNRFDVKEAKELDKISNILDRLDGNLDTMETTDSRAKHFVAQEKAVHEIRQIVRDAKKAAKFDEKSMNKNLKEIGNDEYKEGKILEKIDKEFAGLDDALAKLDDSESKIKSYIEQRKALHEVKRILHNAGRFDKYDNKELESIDSLMSL